MPRFYRISKNLIFLVFKAGSTLGLNRSSFLNKRNSQKTLSVRDGLSNLKNCVILVLALNRKQKRHPDFTHDSSGCFLLSYIFYFTTTAYFRAS